MGTGAVKEGCMGVGSENQGPRIPGNSTKQKKLGGGVGNSCKWGRPSCGGEPGAGGGQDAESSMASDPPPEAPALLWRGWGVLNRSPR